VGGRMFGNVSQSRGTRVLTSIAFVAVVVWSVVASLRPLPLAMDQYFVWVLHNCRLRWLSESQFISQLTHPAIVAPRVRGIIESRPDDDSDRSRDGAPPPRFNVDFAGSSRVEYLRNDFLRYINGASEIHSSFLGLKPRGMHTRTIVKRIKELTASKPYCAAPPGAGNGVLVVSVGMWEVAYERGDLSVHGRFESEWKAYLGAVINALQTSCKGHVVLLTEPQVHFRLVASRSSSAVGERVIQTLDTSKYSEVGLQIESVKSARLTVVNNAFRELAAQHHIPLVDYEALTEARFDACADRTHYVCATCSRNGGEPVCHGPKGQGSAVHQAVIQLLARVVLQQQQQLDNVSEVVKVAATQVIS
jgi:hypothetical protein